MWNIRKKKEPPASANTVTVASITKGMNEQWETMFWEAFVRSAVWKSQGRLADAAVIRSNCVRNVSGKPPYEAMALHNLAVLEFFHLGDGLNAYQHAFKSLDCCPLPTFAELSERMKDRVGFDALSESVSVAAMTADSYDAALSYWERGLAYDGTLRARVQELTTFRKDNPRFFTYQRAISRNHYSRVSQAEDKGDYAPACALMELMLSRAEQPAYAMTYEEYSDVLDDYGICMYMHIMKTAQLLLQQNENPTDQVLPMGRKAVKWVQDFLPDCQPKDKEKFAAILHQYQTIPGL